jgi:hypothetical protein
LRAAAAAVKGKQDNTRAAAVAQVDFVQPSPQQAAVEVLKLL